MLRTILLGAGVFAALLAVLIFSGKLPVGSGKTAKPQGDVVVWGTIPQEKLANLLQTFNGDAQTYRVIYQEVREDMFVQTLVEALASGRGPDMILAPQQIILSQSARLTPFPIASFPEKSFKDMYVDGASLFFTPQGAIAFPVTIEPLVLFYNRTLFSKHGLVNPPGYWDEVVSMVPTLTVKNNREQFLESGIALGASNTPYAKEIIMSVVSQLGQVPVLKQYFQDGSIQASVLANSPVVEGGDVLPLTTVARFFTQFADPTKETYTWNAFSGNADEQFVAEKLAMYIGYSGEYQTLRDRNPRAEFAMTYLPQTRGYTTFATGARIYGVGVLQSSRNPTAAFFVQTAFASGAMAGQIATSIGAVPALRTYASTPGIDPVIGRSMLVARGWYDPYFIQSTGYMTTMISDIVNNRYGVNDATSLFVSRMQDLYSR